MILKDLLKHQPLAIFLKDKYSKYIFCNERHAALAGLDSPSQIVGKTDQDFYWKKHTDYYQKGDFLVMNGKKRINVPELQTRPKKIVPILVTKTPLVDKNNHCIGTIGSYIDIEDHITMKKGGRLDENKQRFYLGELFSNVYLTRRQLQIFRYLLYGDDYKKIALTLQISPATVQWYIQGLKIKFQCHSTDQIIATAIEYGFTYLLETPSDS